MEKDNLPPMECIFTASIKLYADKNNEFYKTDSEVDVNKGNILNKEATVSIDLIMALISELDFLKEQIITKMDITDVELKEFGDTRNVVASGNIAKVESNTSIDDTINHLFDDDEPETGI